MNIFSIEENHSWRNFFTRLALIIASTTIIVWFLPRENKFGYQFDLGKPWKYGSLIAKFDFPVYKSDKTIQKEKDSLIRQYEPYYTYNKSVELEEISKLRSDLSHNIKDIPNEYVERIVNALHRIYQQGIMSTSEYSELFKDSSQHIRIINGKQARRIAITRIYSNMAAYEQLFLDEALAQKRQQLQKYNLNNYIEPNMVFDKTRSEASKRDLMTSVPLASGVVLSGQKIIDRGEIVDEHVYRVLDSFQKESMKRISSSSQLRMTMLGQIIFVAMLMVLFTFYLDLFRKDYYEKPRSILMLYALILIFPILSSFMVTNQIFSVYMLPFAMLPIFVRVFMDSRTAFTAHITMVLICSCALRYPYEFIIVQIVAGLVAIYSLRELSRRSQLLKTALFITLAYMTMYFAIELIRENDITKIDRSMYTHFIVNGIMLLFAYPLMYLIEKAFGFTSNVTLVELSNTNNELLRKMSEVAPGTFQHSIQVGNLAAEVANKIGAKSQLVRTGALYHDIGKMRNPVYFTENQMGVNPHLNKTFEESAQIVINHVTEGLKLADKHNLPRTIKDFICTHHGTGKTKFFYISYKNQHPGEDFDESIFTYPGPNPFTREQAILMMADTVEAASRSLNEYTEKNISDMINRLIDSQVEEGFFRECPITFRDIAVAKVVFIEKLKTIYHTRISYPEEEKSVIS
jgi:cyclic-di-AMP phosphodiesterase PgpH